jgi:TPR repeat protein
MQLAEEGGLVDVHDAYTNLTLAAELGVVPAQVRLGHMLAMGENDLAPDLERAFMWYWIAGDFGIADAYKTAQQLAKNMAPEAIERAKRKASKFRPLGSQRSATNDAATQLTK